MEQKVNSALSFGTLVVVSFDLDRVIACADSRAYSYDTGPTGDFYKKLFQCGKWALCAIAGILTTPNLDVCDEVGKICTAVSPEDSAQEIAQQIAAILGTHFNTALVGLRIPEEKSNIFDCGVIRRDRYGRITVVRIEFPIIRASPLPRFESKITTQCENYQATTPGSLAFGNTECLRLPQGPVFATNASVTDQADALFASAAASSQNCRDRIGGPVDIALIDVTGFQWIRRK